MAATTKQSAITSPQDLSTAQLSLITQAKSWQHLSNVDKRGHTVVRVILGSVVAAGLYLLNQYLTVRITLAAFIRDIDNALKKTGTPLGGQFNGTKIALAFMSPIYNFIQFGNAPSFATAVAYSYYTQEFASSFHSDIPGNLNSLYEQARLNPQWSPLQLVCRTFGHQDGDAICQKMCHPSAPANAISAIGYSASYAMNGFFVAGNNPIGLVIGGLVGLGLYFAQAQSKYNQCKASQSTCITTKNTQCKFWE